MEDTLMEEILQDFCCVLKALEWYKSGDTGPEEYHKEVDKFINKWANSNYASYAKAKRDIVKNLENFIEELK
jgi:hypothetical protein